MKRILSRNRNTKSVVEAVNYSSPSPLKNWQAHTAHTAAKIQVRKSRKLMLKSKLISSEELREFRMCEG